MHPKAKLSVDENKNSDKLIQGEWEYNLPRKKDIKDSNLNTKKLQNVLYMVLSYENFFIAGKTGSIKVCMSSKTR